MIQGNFFTWHRYFVYAYEKALRDECGFRGTQPVSSYPLLLVRIANSQRLVLELVRDW